MKFYPTPLIQTLSVMKFYYIRKVDDKIPYLGGSHSHNFYHDKSGGCYVPCGVLKTAWSNMF